MYSQKDQKMTKMQDDPLFSIILVAYDVSKYIEKAILSVLNSSFDSWELIIIDDGSKDGTYEICQSYEYLSKVNVYQMSRIGLGSARNLALKKATGRYILFLDGDDRVDENIMNHLHLKIKLNEYDLLSFQWQTENNDTGVIANTLNPETTIAVWNKCYRRQWLNDHGIVFLEDVYYEDVSFTLEVIHGGPKSITIPHLGYVYTKRKQSITHMPFQTKNARDTLTVFQHLSCQLTKFNSDFERSYIVDFWWRHLLLMLNADKLDGKGFLLKAMIDTYVSSGLDLLNDGPYKNTSFIMKFKCMDLLLRRGWYAGAANINLFADFVHTLITKIKF